MGNLEVIEPRNGILSSVTVSLYWKPTPREVDWDRPSLRDDRGRRAWHVVKVVLGTRDTLPSLQEESITKQV